MQLLEVSCAVRRVYIYISLGAKGLTRHCQAVYENIRDRQCMYKRNNEEGSLNHCCLRKAVTVTYSECDCVVLVFQHAKRMRRIM